MAEDNVTITLKIPGRPVDQPALPRALQSRLRAVGPAAEDPFLPHDYVKPVSAFNLTAAARATEGGGEEKDVRAQRGQVIALELADGVSVFTSPENLRDTLARVAPEAIRNGAIHLDALRERGIATRSAFGDAASNLITRVTTLDVGTVPDAIIEAARKKALEWLRERGEEKLAEYAELGVSWLGTKALMWAVESRLPQAPGLYRWVAAQGEPGDLVAVDDKVLQSDAQQGPLLVFIHGTASSTAGSYHDLQTASREYWRRFETRFGERIYAFEHRTLSESPIENALQLARALPEKARLNLVTHSRGGLVGDLLCLDKLDGADQALIDAYALDAPSLGGVEPAESKQLRKEIERAYGEQRANLLELAALLRKRQFVIERYVRVACPARGTRLASGNFDVFLSGLLSLIGLVPALAGSPIYSAFKRVVLEIAKNRTNPNLVPGIEAMLPASPMARLLARATPQASTEMAVIAGDIEGGGLLKRLGVLFTDHVFFDGEDNDLVVDTDSMYAGVARAEKARALFDQGPDVSHFRYFTNDVTRSALSRWLIDPNVAGIDAFKLLPGLGAELSARDEALRDERLHATRGLDAASLPVVVVLPGIMGSHLWRNRKDRVWFDFDDLLLGGIDKISFDKPNVEAEKLFSTFYGDLCEHLAATHRVERFPYDWRLPLDALADALAERLETLLDDTAATQPAIRVLAHSMGGLVVRALVYRHRDVWDRVMQRDGARFVMLGTPNQGSHSMVETLIGKGDNIRMLARIDQMHDLQAVLDIVGTFRGALQLLPRPGFKDQASLEAQGQKETQKEDYFEPGVWSDFRREMRDFWFGDGIAAEPTKEALEAARWLWDQDAKSDELTLPPKYQDKVFYVRGCAPNTPCGIIRDGDRWKMLGTPCGDGTVTWVSGNIGGIGRTLYMPAEHGALPNTAEYFASLETLLSRGEAGDLMTSAPAVRGAEDRVTVAYDAGAPVYPTELDLASSIIGCRARKMRPRARPLPVFKVRVCAMDLRGTTRPILVGHYEQDAISGAEALIDRELVKGALTMRYDLGMYAGPLGTATVVLAARNEMERRRGSCRGAVVAGLGEYDGTLSVARLTDVVRTAALRYLLHILDSGEGELRAAAEPAIPIASLLLGYSSSANLTINDSVTALLRGIVEANNKFSESTGSPLRIAELEIVELYIDTAISAAYAVRRVAAVLNDDPNLRCRIEADTDLRQGEGMRERLEGAEMATSYWPRMIVTGADRREDGSLPECNVKPGDGEKDDAVTDNKPVQVPDRRPPLRRQQSALADNLKFLYLGQRARAETVLQQRQPGLIEKLVAQQLHVRSYQEDFSRTLFQLLVPHDFKDAARQFDRIVVVLDDYTANLPWELMLADDKPLAVKTALVRQLSTTRFSTRVRTAMKRAYVVGNPYTVGFAAAFPRPGREEPVPLPAAENEANAVTDVLTQYGYDVVRSIGQDQKALDVINRLYKAPYRVLHIAAHGIFDECHVDGRKRTGVVLSDGLLITAAEIAAMEVIPELVFLNCCHLGQIKINRAPAEFNRLAYSIASELIELGVRGIVVAGWAVDDEAATLFAETFYRAVLAGTKPFGDAVFEARKATWERFPSSITWGAYQVYGDPGWRLEPRRDDYGAAAPREIRKLVTPEELIAQIAQQRMEVGRLEKAIAESEARRIAGKVEHLLAQAPAAWLKRPHVCAELGRLYADLGQGFFDRAIEYYTKAIKDYDKAGRVPVTAIEQLANLEARTGEVRDDEAPVKRAIARLIELCLLVSGDPELGLETGQPTDAADKSGQCVKLEIRRDVLKSGAINRERAALLGSAYKRLATVYARQYFRPGTDETTKADIASKWLSALACSAHWYGSITDLAARDVDPYNGLNWLFLVALAPDRTETGRRTEFARRCAAAARKSFRDDPNFWNAIIPADAFLVESLLDGSLAGPASSERVEQLVKQYREAMTGVAVKPKELDSTVRQICLMALFFAVQGKIGAVGGEGELKVANALKQLAEQLMPGSCDAAVAGATASAEPPRKRRSREPRKQK